MRNLRRLVLCVFCCAAFACASASAQTPTPTPPSADIAPSGFIDSDDLRVFSQHWHENETDFGPVPGDFNGSGKPDADDLLFLLEGV